MPYGRITVVLGVQTGLGAIIQSCEGARKGVLAPVVPGTTKNRLTDAEILAVLAQLAQLDRQIRRENVSVTWSALGASPALEIPLLARVLGISVEKEAVVGPDELRDVECDALVYVPLDVQQPRMVEQLARLSMILPRTRHVALAAAPKWSHVQLMALRETWDWTDPRQQVRVITFGEEMIRLNGGLTRRDIARVELPEPRETFVDPVIITRSPKMKETLNLIDAVADSDSTILITGDSGTGKELIAQRIHARSHRRNQALVAVNCGAIPSELLESELFGHVKGAFTGAVSNREGRFEAAEKGTLFLDEIGEMGPNLQVKLLRVLQTRRFEPVGATKSKAADVRIITATHKDLELEVKEQRFREDLFYRLNVIPIHIPGLRERREDIHLLVEHFIKKFNKEKFRRVTGVARAGLRALAAYDWPGNVRELENLMERMVILKSSGMIDLLDFPEKYRRQALSEIEYDDLMAGAKAAVPAPAASATAPPHAGAAATVMHPSEEDDELGEEAFMKITGTFTKSHIEQSATEQTVEAPRAPQAEAAPTGEALSVEHAIRLLQDNLLFPNEGLDFNSIVDQFENILILRALEKTNWNRNRAAGLLRLNRTTLVEKLKKKQLMPPMRLEQGFIEGNV